MVKIKRMGGGGGAVGRRFLLNLINGGLKINGRVKISKNPLISVMIEERDINV